MARANTCAQDWEKEGDKARQSEASVSETRKGRERRGWEGLTYYYYNTRV